VTKSAEFTVKGNPVLTNSLREKKLPTLIGNNRGTKNELVSFGSKAKNNQFTSFTLNKPLASRKNKSQDEPVLIL
jgi:hypothetical protein